MVPCESESMACDRPQNTTVGRHDAGSVSDGWPKPASDIPFHNSTPPSIFGKQTLAYQEWPASDTGHKHLQIGHTDHSSQSGTPLRAAKATGQPFKLSFVSPTRHAPTHSTVEENGQNDIAVIWEALSA